MRVYGINVLKELPAKKIQKVYTSRKEVVSYCGQNKIKYEYVDNKFLKTQVWHNYREQIKSCYVIKTYLNP